MKKYFIIAAVAMVAMASCTKTLTDETAVLNKKIGFEVANYTAQTKANVALTNAEDGLYQFHTYAYQFPKVGNAVEFMNTDIFAWNNATPPVKVTSGTNIYMWAPEDDYYWPKTGYINFYSYAGTENLYPTESVSNGMKTVTLTYADKVIASTSNIMVADAALHFNANQSTYAVDGTENAGDPNADPAVAATHVTTGVPTLFRHMLAKLYMDVKIQIPAAKVSNNTIWKVQVLEGFDLDGDNSIADTEKSAIIPVNKGTLTLTNDDALAANAALNTATQQWTRTQTGNDVVSGWKPGSTTEQIQLSQANVLTMPAGATESKKTENNNEVTAVEQLLAWRTVMPQLTDNVALKLVYKVQALHVVNNVETVFMEEIRTVGIDAAANIHNLTGSIDKWESNKKITYHIIIDPVSEKVTFDPAVEDYGTVEANSNSTININNNGIVTP